MVDSMESGRLAKELKRKLQESGGASMSPAGRAPGKGTMVALTGSEEVVHGFPSTNRLQSFVDAHQGRVGASPGRYFGAWHDDGKTYLDVSQRWPTQEGGMIAGHANSQISVYDTRTGNTPTMASSPAPIPGLIPENDAPSRIKRRRSDQFTGELARRSTPKPTRPGGVQGSLF